MGEHLLCKQGVVGSNPSVSMAEFRRQRSERILMSDI